jgi:hypothetical protein
VASSRRAKTCSGGGTNDKGRSETPLETLVRSFNTVVPDAHAVADINDGCNIRRKRFSNDESSAFLLGSQFFECSSKCILVVGILLVFVTSVIVFIVRVDGIVSGIIARRHVETSAQVSS